MGKSATTEELLENLSQELYGRSRKDNCCVKCGSTKVNHEDFTDKLSRKEFELTHWCQICQDEVFGTNLEDPEDD